MQASVNPSLPERLAEAAVAQTVAQERPATHDGRSRKSGQALEDWLANVAYWRLYGDSCPPSLPTKGEDGCRAAWVRLRGLVGVALSAAPPVLPQGGTWVWPLRLTPLQWKSGGKFGAKRPWKGPQTRYHCGVDINANLGTEVLAPEAGEILSGGHGWEKPTQAVLLRADSGRTVLLGGVATGTGPPAGRRVKAGDVVATVGRYPKGDTMLHVQVYDRPLTIGQVYARQSWALGQPRPDALVDPAELLRSAMKGAPLQAASGPDDNGETDEGVLQLGVDGLLAVFLGVA